MLFGKYASVRFWLCCFFGVSFSCFVQLQACSPSETCEAPKVLVDGQCTQPTTEKTPSEPAQQEKVIVDEGSSAPEPTPDDAGAVKENKPEPRPEPRPEPKPEPKDASVPEEAKPEPRPEPRPEPTPEPMLEIPPEGIGPTPNVSFEAPKDKDKLKGQVTIKIKAEVQGGPKIARVSLYVNDKLLGEKTAAPYEFAWDTTKVADKVHTLKAVALTTWGKSEAATIDVEVENTVPVITFLKPQVESNVSGKVDIEVKVTSSQGLKAKGVVLKVDLDGTIKTLAWTSTTPTYKAVLDLSKESYGSVFLEVEAESVSGKKSKAESVVIHAPPVGPKKRGETCDPTDAKLRCIKGYSCIDIDGNGLKCRRDCIKGGLLQCIFPGSTRTHKCQVTFPGLKKRGTCIDSGPAPGTLYASCSSATPCRSSSHLCVNGPNSGKSFCLPRCTPGSGGPSRSNCAQGFICLGVTGQTGGVCVEQCGQRCKVATDCATGQTCQSGACSAPFCPRYGTCANLTGLPSKICL